MTAPLLQELQQHAAALRRLARDLVGATGADDVLQDTALEVMRAPPRQPGPLLAWLRQVVRHVAGKQRRAEAIRRRHEAAAASERAFATAGAATVDALRELTEWVAALPEPYRSTLLARYVQDLPPSAIARVSGVPVRTVKTRLQRGLQLLRERGERSGGDWRSGLVVAFGCDGTHAMTTATAVTGVLAMATMKKFVAAAVVAVAALVVWREVAPGTPAAVARVDAARPASPVVAPLADAQPPSGPTLRNARNTA